MRSRLFGGTLLVIGTSIGGGMLALPIVTAGAGIFYSVLSLIGCWLLMTLGALLILEVNLRLPEGSHMVSMARETLGLPGQIIAWVTFLFLLYTLLAAYISGGGDLIYGLLHEAHIELPRSLTTCLFTLVFGGVIYSGIRAVDYVNRGLMFAKLGTYLILIIIITPYIQIPKWSGGEWLALPQSVMVLITSFGFATILPSLRDYFKSDVNELRQLIFMGSLIPLVAYIIWIAAIDGVIERFELIKLMTSSHATSGLSETLRHSIHHGWINAFFNFFSSICMLTAFLGVSLGLFDFLSDGLKLKKNGRQGWLILCLTFTPALVIVLLYPGIYIQALNYAGISCVILLLILPILMAWQGRKNANPNKNQVPGGSVMLGFLAIMAMMLLIIAYHDL